MLTTQVPDSLLLIRYNLYPNYSLSLPSISSFLFSNSARFLIPSFSFLLLPLLLQFHPAIHSLFSGSLALLHSLATHVNSDNSLRINFVPNTLISSFYERRAWEMGRERERERNGKRDEKVIEKGIEWEGNDERVSESVHSKTWATLPIISESLFPTQLRRDTTSTTPVSMRRKDVSQLKGKESGWETDPHLMSGKKK